MEKYPIDLVVTWVDGNDKEWQREKVEALGTNSGDDRIIRYRDWDIMKYWFRGVEECIPFINRIHFITWGHLPEFLNVNHEKLNIIKHTDYIPSEYLPTFNSNVIELNLHRIEDLAEHFILANDDFFFLKKVNEDFFFKKGLPRDAALQNVLQFHKSGGIGHIMANDLEWLNKKYNKRSVMFKNFSKWFNLKYGFKAFYNLYLLPFSNFTGFDDPHIPFSYLKSEWETLWNESGEALDKICHNKLRDSSDINHWLIRYRQMVKGNFCPANYKRGEFYIIGEDDEKIKNAILSKKIPMACFSDDNVDIDFEKEKKFLKEILEKRFPHKSKFEL